MKPLQLAILLISLTITLNAYGQTCLPLTTGCLDPTFGSSGTLAISVPTTGAVPRDVVSQSDGKIVSLIGNRSNSSTYYLMRNNADGSVDTSFGNNGLATATWGFTHKAFIYYGDANAIAIQNVNGSERILLAGSAPKLYGKSVQTLFRVDRFMPDGSPDTSFGNNGSVFLQLGQPKAMAIQAWDQKIVTVSSDTNELVRLTTNGSLDPTFGTGGKVTSPDAYRVAIDPSGSIVVAGWLYSRHGSVVSNNASLRRYSSSGILDATFGTNGMAVVSHSFQSFRLKSLSIDNLGNLVLGGTAQDPPTGFMDYAVARFTPAGFQDTSFSVDGIATAGFSTYNGTGGTALVQSDAKIILVGSVRISSSILDAGVVRFNYDGTLDNTFGTGGTTTFEIAGDDYVSNGSGGVIQMDPGCTCEKIVVTGGSDHLTTFARLIAY